MSASPGSAARGKTDLPLYLLPQLRPEAHCRHCSERIFWIYELGLWLDGERVDTYKRQTPQVHEHRAVCRGLRPAERWVEPVAMPRDPLSPHDHDAAVKLTVELDDPEWLQ